jgi:hypothetical protein
MLKFILKICILFIIPQYPKTSPWKEYAAYTRQRISKCIESIQSKCLKHVIEGDSILFFFYVQIIKKASLFIKKLPIINLVQTTHSLVTVQQIEPSGEISFFEPTIIGESHHVSQRTVEVPSKWLATITNATVLAGTNNLDGGFQVVTPSGFIVCEPAGDPRIGFIAGIHSFVFLAKNKKKSHVVVYYNYNKEEFISEAILLSGKCSPNYFHWLIEYLARVYIISKFDNLKKIPLIVDAKLHPQEIESLKIVFPDWPIHYLDRHALLHVKKLHVPSIQTYHPDNPSIPWWQASALCYRTLDYLCEIIKKGSGLTSTSTTPTRKIFIARRGHRSILNVTEIELALANFGFEIIDPAKLTFTEQVHLFASAKVLVGALGAAFSNLIFCQKGTKVLGVCSPYAKRFCMQANLALYSGCDYKLLVGETTGYVPGKEDNLQNTLEDLYLLHSSFSVNLPRLIQALKDWEIIDSDDNELLTNSN